MGFTITALPNFEEEIALPNYRHGKITVVFNFVPPAKFKEVVESHRDKPNKEVLGSLISGWSGVKDDDGAEVPYSIDALGVVLDALYCGELMYSAWMKGLHGARAKN